eukprot:403367440
MNLTTLLHVSTNPASKNQLAGNIIGLGFFQTAGLLTNSRWIYTTPAMTITTVGKVAYYASDLNIKDYTTIIQFIVNLGLLCYACYNYELNFKTQLIQIFQINKMNGDLQNVLQNFPEGIILYSEEKQEIIMANQETKRILKIPVAETNQRQILNNKLGTKQQDDTYKVPLKNKLWKEILRPVNLLNQQENNNIELSESQANGRYSIVKAPYEFQDGQCFLVEDSCDEIIPKNQLQSDHNITSDTDDQQKEMITIRENKIFYQDQTLRMIMIKCLTPLMKYEKLKLENHFYEMLTATVSHDMRTPLNSMLGLLQNIKTMVGDPRGQKLLQIVENSSQILLYLVNDLLDFTQIKNGKFTKNELKVNIKDTVQIALDIVRLAIQEKGLNLEYKFSDNIPSELITDSQRINQVLLNLLQNALKFTPKGVIKVSIDYNEFNHQLSFQVSDQGCGIKSDDKKKLFTLFGKLEATAKINTSGIGLGLNICKKIVELLGGDINVEDNQDGPGSTFTFTIQCYWEDKIDLYISPLLTKRYQGGFFNFEEEKENLILRSINSIAINIDNDIDDIECLGNKLNNLSTFSKDIKSSSYHISNELNYDISDVSTNSAIIKYQLKKELNLSQLDKKKFIGAPTCKCDQRNDILVVDDNIFNIVTLQTILEYQYNLKSDKAMNGQEALDKVNMRYCEDQENPCLCHYNKKNYKVIFMDCNMPIMDGFHSSQEIRKISLYQQFEPYIVSLTAYTTDNFKDKSKQCGMDCYINKPVNAEQIKGILIQQGILDQ